MRIHFAFVLAGCLCNTSVMAQQPSPGLHDELLDHLAGSWHLDRRIRGMELSNSVTAEWVLNHQFLEVHMKDDRVPAKYEAIVLIGYNAKSRTYVAHWTDTFGGAYSALGEGVRTGNAIEFRFAYDDGPFFNTFNWLPDEDRWVMRLESGLPDGTRRPFATDTLSRP